MRKFTGLLALALLLSFGVVTTLTYAGDPAPAPTDEKDKKNPGGPKADEQKDEKKDDKGGK